MVSTSSSTEWVSRSSHVWPTTIHLRTHPSHTVFFHPQPLESLPIGYSGFLGTWRVLVKELRDGEGTLGTQEKEQEVQGGGLL